MKNIRKNINCKNGFSLIEVVVGVSIIASSVFFTMFVAQLSQRVIGDGVSRLQATFLAEEGVEAIKAMRDTSWQTNISSLQQGLSYYLYFDESIWKSTSSPIYIDNIFERTFSIYNVNRNASDDIVLSGGVNDPNTKKITVNVTWTGRAGTTTESMSTYITNIFSN